jgi:hypothetical protein
MGRVSLGERVEGIVKEKRTGGFKVSQVSNQNSESFDKAKTGWTR